jgi:predicted permease
MDLVPWEKPLAGVRRSADRIHGVDDLPVASRLGHDLPVLMKDRVLSRDRRAGALLGLPARRGPAAAMGLQVQGSAGELLGRARRVIGSFLPIWLLTVVGYVTGRTRILGDQGESVLGRFVFHVAMPATLFATLSGTRLDRFSGWAIATFGAGTAVTCLLGFAAGRWVFGRGLGDQAISGMAAGYVNSANLGIPVAVQLLGNTSFIVSVMLFQVLVVTPVVLTVIDVHNGAGERSRLRDFVLLPTRNPIIIACVLGVAVAGVGWHLPQQVLGPCRLLGAAAVPAALVALGMSLHGHAPGAGLRSRGEVAVAVTLKIVFQPCVAFVLGRYAVHLSRADLLAVVACSALPTAQNAFIFAREYGLRTELVRSSIVASSVLSMLSLLLATWLLGTAPAHG